MALTTNLVAYWKLDESSGNAIDATGNGYTLTNSNTVTYSAGKINNGANLGTANTSKQLSTTSNLGITSYAGGFTMMGWMKPLTEIATGTYMIMSATHLNPLPDTIIMYQYNGGTRRLTAWWRDNSEPQIYSVGALGTTNFTHVALTFNGTNLLTFYVNGASVGTFAASPTTTGGDVDGFAIGAYQSSDFASALIDEVGVWSRALSAGEISQIYNGGTGSQYPFLGNSNNFFALL